MSKKVAAIVLGSQTRHHFAPATCRITANYVPSFNLFHPFDSSVYRIHLLFLILSFF